MFNSTPDCPAGSHSSKIGSRRAGSPGRTDFREVLFESEVGEESEQPAVLEIERRSQQLDRLEEIDAVSLGIVEKPAFGILDRSPTEKIEIQETELIAPLRNRAGVGLSADDVVEKIDVAQTGCRAPGSVRFS